MMRALIPATQRVTLSHLRPAACPAAGTVPSLLPRSPVAAMSSKDDTPQGMATEGLPKGPEIQEHSQRGQPGIQAEMETPPETTRLPNQHGHDEVLKLEEYTGVGKLKGRRVIVTGGDSGIGLSAAVLMAREGAHGVAVVHHPSEGADATRAKASIEAEGARAAAARGPRRGGARGEAHRGRCGDSLGQS